MLYAEVMTEVMQTLRRPEKIGTARRKVNEAITFFCLDNDFARDFKEITVAIDPNEFTQAIPLSLFERFRKEKYIKRSGIKKPLDIISHADIFSKRDFCDSYYIVGDSINISMRVKATNMDVGYFQYPPILNETTPNSFWLLDINPWMVIDRALSNLFRDIGDEKSMREHATSARENYMAFRKDQLTGS